jgi:cytochrome c-type biogenesis protein CcmH
MALVLLAALFVGSRHQAPASAADRERSIAAQLRCPTCAGQSVAESEAPAAQAIREEIHRRVGEGQSKDEIVAFILSRYPDSRIVPEASGFGAVVWVLPVLAGLGTVAALAAVYRRRRAGRPAGTPSSADRELVERALRSR